MIAEWMLYCSLCALGLFVAAIVAERALLAAGGPVRHAWVGALALSLAIPVATYELAPRPTAVTVKAPLAETAVPASLVEDTVTSAASGSSVVAAPISPRGWDQNLRILKRADGAFAAAWVVLSTSLALYFLIGIVALRWMRRKWESREVCGVPVLVSEHTGPAVVGAIAPAIVMPEWALAMAPHQLSLMVRHEEEHRRAGDPQLLTFAQLALIVMPWNAALWWVIVRLGMAVELDCDARVLRDADPRSYGDLLLEVARPRRAPRFIIATAFAERAGQLERRIRAIARRRDRASRGAKAAAALAGFVAISIAWVAPHPAVPSRLVSQTGQAPVAPSPAPASLDIAKRAQLLSIRQETVVRTSARRGSPTFRGDATILMPGAKLTASGLVLSPVAPATPPRMPSLQASQLDSAIFDRLFAGVTLTSDQEAKARTLINKLLELQVAQDHANLMARVQTSLLLLDVTMKRDAGLRALISNDADLATLNSRLAQMSTGGGRRGRSGTGSPPAVSEVPAGGGRGGGRGRSGGAGAPGLGGVPVLQEVPITSVAAGDGLLRILFDGITLTPVQEVTARTIIVTAQQQMLALYAEAPMVEMRMLPNAGVLMRPETRAVVLDLLSNDADRNLVDSRIATETRIVVPPRIVVRPQPPSTR